MNERVVNNNGYKTNGSINMTYVSFIKGTIPTYLLAKVIPTWDIVKNDNFSGKKQITVKTGQYLELSRVQIVK